MFPKLCLLFRFLDEDFYKFLTSPTVRYLPRVLFSPVEFCVEKYHEPFLSGPGVTTAWNILRLQLEDTTSRYAM